MAAPAGTGNDRAYSRPASRDDFEIAIICALTCEMDAVQLLVDEFLDEVGQNQYGRLAGDTNIYAHARIGNLNVVLITLPEMGKGQAALAAGTLTTTYPKVSLVLSVGVCGGVPLAKVGGRDEEIVLGDVVISNMLTQYDMGRQFPDRFVARTEIEHLLGRPKRDIRGLLKDLESRRNRNILHKKVALYLEKLQHNYLQDIDREHFRDSASIYVYPGAEHDKLFEDSYEHMHRGSFSDPGCHSCAIGSVCDSARRKLCDEVGCDAKHLAPRERRGEPNLPRIFIGHIGSADTVMRSAQHRRDLAEEGIIGFEMEAAGVWDVLPCIVIKGVCDYADSHKNKRWQDYAAATAASAVRAFLDHYYGTGRISGNANDRQGATKGGHYRVKFSLQGMPTSNNFVPRPSDITDIEKSLLPHHQKSQGRNVFVLHGLGGIGKTQLAVNFARQYKAAFSAIFWLDGTSEDSLKQSFASCAKRIPKDQIPENIRSPKTGDEVDLDDIVEHVQEWLAKDNNVDWLLIFDNVDLDHTQGEIPGAYDIRKYLRSDHGAVLITSRLSKLAQLGESKRIKRADLDLSKKIFEKWYGKELNSKLGGLPLALAQAAAYMGELNLHVASYIRLYEQQWNELFQNTDSSPQDYGNRSVWTTWTISFNAIEARDKTAGNLLRLWAFLDNREMWHSLLQVARNDKEQWPKWLCDIACNEVKFLNMATLLLRYSMIEVRESAQSSYSMHPVVHRWISHIQDDAGKRVFLRLAVMLIGFSVPHDTTKNYWVLQRRLLPHAERCLWWMEELKGGECNTEDITIGHATHSLGNLYSDQGRLKEAETMYQRALEGYEKALGPDHTSTLNTVNNLGNLYKTQGRLKEAKTMYQRALEGKEKALGPDHTSTLDIVGNLGNLYSDQGLLKEAETMYQRALEGKEKALGPDHTSTLDTVNNLGNLYKTQGRLKEAETMYQRALEGKEKRALEGYEKALGPDHTSTLNTVNNLGLLYSDQGRLKEAETMYQRALSGYSAALGSSHAKSLLVIKNIASLQLAKGSVSLQELIVEFTNIYN
ncbi:hypothetical protein QBC45DRAFT_477241 [Copromyces sp. CBS 386.78]|nr:hypothetical protein QBC45DRAFT_477241 [Copromyces sp. CBS 386.78]